MDKALTNWKIEQRPFYPLGIMCHANEKKCIIMTWDHQHLCVLSFKSIREAIVQNKSPDKQFCIPEINGQINGIITGTRESVMLLDTGAVMYFASQRIVSAVKYVRNIKTICATKQGFAMISQFENQIQIHLHPDSFSQFSQSDVQTYDISFESNYCQSTWDSTQFYIAELHSNGMSTHFFRFLQNSLCDELGNQAIFFSIDQMFLVLVLEPNSEYRVNHIQTFTSCIQKIWQSSNRTEILLLLEAPIVEIIYFDIMSGCVRNNQLFLGDEIVAVDFCNDILVYTTKTEMIQARIYFCSKIKQYKLNRQVIQLYGGIVISIVQNLKIVFCLSENRTFYAIPLRQDTNEDADNLETSIEIDRFLDRANEEMIDLLQLAKEYDTIQAEITAEIKKYQVIALKYNQQNDLKIAWTVHVYIHKTIPAILLSGSTIFLQAFDSVDYSDLYFIQLCIEANQFEDIFSSSLWNVLIKLDSILCYNLRLFSAALKQPFNCVLPWKKTTPNLVPKLSIELNTTIQLRQDFIYISYVPEIEPYSIDHLIEYHCKLPNFRMDSAGNCQQTMGKQKPIQTEENCAMFQYNIRLPNQVTFNDISVILSNQKHTEIIERFYLVLFDYSIEIEKHKTDSIIHLKGNNPEILYHVKKYFFHKLMERFEFSWNSSKMELASKEAFNIAFEARINDKESIDNQIQNALNCVDKIRCLYAELNLFSSDNR